MAKIDKVGAVLLAAGRSKRFRSAHSKLIHSFAGRPMIQWPLCELGRIGADPIIVVVGHRADEVRETCGEDVGFALQGEPLGTGHAVLAAERALGRFAGPLLILSGDLPLLTANTLRKVVRTHRRTGAILTLTTALVDDPSGWGRIVRGPRGEVRAIVEEQDAGEAERKLRDVNVGVYCARPSFLFRTLRSIEPDNAQGEIYLTDIVSRAVAAGLRVADVRAPAVEAGQINERAELARMEKVLRLRINGAWMKVGVTLEDPESTYIEPQVQIGRDTVIGPNVHLKGQTRIGEGCRFDGSAFLTDSTVGDGVHIRFGVVMTGAEVGADCQIGPFAHLRPATRLMDEVHIGDFVETKNARLGRRTKANHLAYLGDTEIGEETNIGAGTITCNYDGFRKHRTTVGDRVQVGSDTQLVAPVTLGDDVYVASGTTVRRDVPAGAMVFNPRQQAHRPGWVRARRAREAAEPPPATPKGKHETLRVGKRTRSDKTPKRTRRPALRPTRRGSEQ